MSESMEQLIARYKQEILQYGEKAQARRAAVPPMYAPPPAPVAHTPAPAPEAPPPTPAEEPVPEKSPSAPAEIPAAAEVPEAIPEAVETPIAEEAPVAEDTAVPAEIPAQKDVPTSDEIPVTEEASTPKETPAEEPPIPEAIPIAEEPPIPQEIPKEAPQEPLPFHPAEEEPLPGGRGALKVQVFASDGAYPIANTRVAVFRTVGGRNRLLHDCLTDVNGLAENLLLPAPDPLPAAQGPAFASYGVLVEHPAYLRSVFPQVAVYDGVESIKPVFLLPKLPGMREVPEVLLDA